MVAYDKKSQTKISHVLWIMWSQEVTRQIKNVYISTSARPVATKSDRVMAFEKGLPPTMVTQQNSHVVYKKSYISFSAWIMATKLDRVMAYGIGPPRTKLYDLLVT